MHKYHKSCSQLLWPFYGLLQQYDLKWEKPISLRNQCTSITNRFLSLVDRFKAYYNVMTWKVRKLISPRFQCTSITTRFLSLVDRFTALYNSMSLNLRKLVSLRFQCISITFVFSASLTVLRLVTTVWPEMIENLYLRDFSAQVSQIVFLDYLTVYGLIQLYDLKYQKTHISAI